MSIHILSSLIRRSTAYSSILYSVANETEGHRTVHWADKDGVLRATEEPLSDLNERFLDVAFTGRPAQCNVSSTLSSNQVLY